MDLPDHPRFRAGRGRDLYLNFGAYGGEVEVACFSADGSRALTVQEVGGARVWEVASGRQVGEIRPTSPLEGRPGVGSGAAGARRGGPAPRPARRRPGA